LNFEILGAATLMVVIAFLLKNFGFKGAPVFSGICVVLLLLEAVPSLFSPIVELLSFGEGRGVIEPMRAAVKILCVGYLFGICADICREMSENGIAKAVEVAGRVEIIIIVLPHLKEIINMGAGLL
jgi:stage III sporulation protein AD